MMILLFLSGVLVLSCTLDTAKIVHEVLIKEQYSWFYNREVDADE